jgi:hypothetical protein
MVVPTEFVKESIMADDNRALTFEEIDAHIRKADLSAFEPGGRHHFTSEMVAAAPGNVLANVCRIYHVIRPILQALLLVPFIPATWKAAIKTFIALMDTLCP